MLRTLFPVGYSVFILWLVVARDFAIFAPVGGVGCFGSFIPLLKC